MLKSSTLLASSTPTDQWPPLTYLFYPPWDFLRWCKWHFDVWRCSLNGEAASIWCAVDTWPTKAHRSMSGTVSCNSNSPSKLIGILPAHRRLLCGARMRSEENEREKLKNKFVRTKMRLKEGTKRLARLFAGLFVLHFLQVICSYACRDPYFDFSQCFIAVFISAVRKTSLAWIMAFLLFCCW